MKAISEHGYIQSYEHAIQQLEKKPNDRHWQHQAVLSLARTGALDFAIKEYNRYGLNTIRNHEDIMALAGRLSKDLFLRSDGTEALEHARDAAEKYEAAFQSTKGYYSGINAATMAFMADMPREIVSARARAIVDVLPPMEKLSATDHYFIEATRAECFLLIGDMNRLKVHFKQAIRFDPLNYTAHASTIKQFKMILSKKGEETDWLNSFLPPKALHYAGHIHLSHSSSERETLLNTIADHIQKQDIGFGYGALAAGSDIYIAEALLEHGAELHVILPCPIEAFFQQSVQPFGAQWSKRYWACLERAKSVTIVSDNVQTPQPGLNRLTGQFAMGQAILRGQYFDSAALQLLIWDSEKTESSTAHHAKDWIETGRDQIIISVKSKVLHTRNESTYVPSYSLKLGPNIDEHSKVFNTAAKAIEFALTKREAPFEQAAALHVHMTGEGTETVLSDILSYAPPGSILMSDMFASLLVLFEKDRYTVNFAGLIKKDHDRSIRCYALNN